MISKLNKLLVANIILLTSYTITQAQDPIAAFELNATGRPIVALTVNNLEGVPKAHIQQYSTSGILDASFGTNGNATIDVPGAQFLKSLIVHPDNSLSSAGSLNNGTHIVYLLARFTPEGLADTSFGNSGVVTILDQAYSVGNAHALFNAETLIAIAGQIVNTNAVLGGICTLSSTGAIGAKAQLDLAGDTTITDIAQSSLAPNKAVVIGSSRVGGRSQGFVAQYDLSLTSIELDTTFGNSGIVLTTPSSDSVRYKQLSIDVNGNIVVVGQRNDAQVIERYTPTGAVDTSFGLSGSFTMPDDVIITTIACQENGKILVGGYDTVQGIKNLTVLRVLSDGQGLDTSFGNQLGAFVLVSNNNSSQANHIAINASGCVFAAGSLDDGLLLLELDPDGIPVIDFGEGGEVAPSLEAKVSTTILCDKKTSGANGGSFTANTVTRTLNTKVGTSADVSLHSNQFTLQPGCYVILASAPASQLIGSHQISLFDVTHDATVAIGTSQSSLLLQQSRSELRHMLTLTAETTFEVRHTGGVLSALPTALGAAASLGMSEVYTEVVITRL